MIEFNKKRILVLGLGKSGKAAVRLLKTLDVEIFVSDEKGLEKDHIYENTTYIEYQDILNQFEHIDIIVKSPGIKFDIEILEKAREKGILIISEIELAFHFIGKTKVIVGITGTNGKTTTTSLITSILLDSNVNAISVGNIGYSLCDAILDDVPTDVYVLELSSFQLQDILHFRPHVALLLNISEAHIDYHNNFNNYVNAKMNLIKNLTPEDYLIYNEDDKIIKKRVRKIKCTKYSFSLRDNDADCYIENGIIKFNGQTVMSCDEIKLLGEHNLYNILASVSIAKAFYIENENIKKAVNIFESLPHRIQFVGSINNVSYYNDSKSTNELSTICALNAFNKELILILGGYDRKQNFIDIIKHKNVKLIISYGETKEKIMKESNKFNKPCLVCENLIEALKTAKENARPNDIVLFSPASASWDQYKNYEERGEHFIQLFKQLHEEDQKNAKDF